MKKVWEELEQMLKTFDYTYEFSDDGRVWKVWNEKEKATQQLINAMAKVDKKRVQKLIDKYKSKYGTQFEIEN